MPTIRIKTGTRGRLDGTVTQLKKHRKGRVSHDDAIQNLYKQIKDLKAEKREWQANKVLADATKNELDSLGEGAETIKENTDQAIIELSEHANCPHYTLGGDVVLCRKDYFKKGVLHRVPEDVCMKCWQANKDVLMPTLEGDIQPCLCRYEHAHNYFCVKNPPRAVKLIHALKTCAVCPDRLTKARAEHLGLILTTKKYVICGAVEKHDEKVGLMLRCPRTHQWTNLDLCEEIGCSQFKTIQATIGASTDGKPKTT